MPSEQFPEQDSYQVRFAAIIELACVVETQSERLLIKRITMTSYEAPWPIDPSEPRTSWGFYRQDHSGLYEGSLFSLVDPCASDAKTSTTSALPPRHVFANLAETILRKAPATEYSDDVRLLAYPLRIGAAWSFVPGVTARLEALERIEFSAGTVAPAYRVRVEIPGLDIWQLKWYSRGGLVKEVDHATIHCQYPVCGPDWVMDSVTLLEPLPTASP